MGLKRSAGATFSLAGVIRFCNVPHHGFANCTGLSKRHNNRIALHIRRADGKQFKRCIVVTEFDQQRSVCKFGQSRKAFLDNARKFANAHMRFAGTIEQLQPRLIKALDLATTIDPR